MLTNEGSELQSALTPLQDWAYRWTEREENSNNQPM